tara:strand:+ start:1516 stop:2211 length:696 start_codon:yes stop_codon:yes gene_type:complete
MNKSFNNQSGQYDLIHIQKEVNKDFKFVLQNDEKYDNVRRNRIYKKGITKFINTILNLYKPYKDCFVLDYNKENCYFSIMSVIQGYNTIYINKDKEHNKYIEMNTITNNITEKLNILNVPRQINTIFSNDKKRYVLLKIVNHSDEIFSTTRLINKERLSNIIILRDEYKKENPETFHKLSLKCYKFYKLSNRYDPIRIDNIYEFINKKNKIPIACIHQNSKFRDSLTIYFD